MKKFNVRVYGILIDSGKVLVSDELIKGHAITKFPGGGLEFGEGTIDCIKREFLEELQLPINVLLHYYTTDYFVPSAFSNDDQIISIYYLVKPLEEIKVKISEQPHDYEYVEHKQSFRWLYISNMSEQDFTMPIDKKVAEMICRMAE